MENGGLAKKLVALTSSEAPFFLVLFQKIIIKSREKGRKTKACCCRDQVPYIRKGERKLLFARRFSHACIAFMWRRRAFRVKYCHRGQREADVATASPPPRPKRRMNILPGI